MTRKGLKMEQNQENKTEVPYIVHEGILARLERVIRRLWITVIVLIVLLVGCNIAWLVYESQKDTATQTVTQESDGEVSVVGGNVIYGKGND